MYEQNIRYAENVEHNNVLCSNTIFVLILLIIGLPLYFVGYHDTI